MYKVGDIVTFPQMKDDPEWERESKMKFRIKAIKSNGDIDLEEVK